MSDFSFKVLKDPHPSGLKRRTKRGHQQQTHARYGAADRRGAAAGGAGRCTRCFSSQASAARLQVPTSAVRAAVRCRAPAGGADAVAITIPCFVFGGSTRSNQTFPLRTSSGLVAGSVTLVGFSTSYLQIQIATACTNSGGGPSLRGGRKRLRRALHCRPPARTDRGGRLSFERRKQGGRPQRVLAAFYRHLVWLPRLPRGGGRLCEQHAVPARVVDPAHQPLHRCGEEGQGAARYCASWGSGQNPQPVGAGTRGSGGTRRRAAGRWALR